MPARRLAAALIFAAAVLAARVHAQAPEENPPRTDGEQAEALKPMPDWALVRLAFSGLGTSFDQLSAFGDKIMTNSGALARGAATNWLFSIPIDEGLDPKRPAAIFWLDAESADGSPPLAYALPLADAAKFKAVLAAAYNAEETSGVQKIVIPQGFDKPEKVLFARAEGSFAIVAPDEETLGKLKAWTALGGKLVPADAPAAVASLNLPALRKKLGGEATALDGIFGALMPAAARQLPAVKAQLRAMLGDLERLEFHVSVAPSALNIAAHAHAKPETQLAKWWAKPPAKFESPLVKALPADAFACAAAPLSYLVWLEEQAGAAYEARAEGAGHEKDLAPARDAWRAALAALYGKLQGEALYALRSPEDGKVEGVGAIGSSEPAAARAAFDAYLKALASYAEKAARLEAKLAADAPAPFALEALDGGEAGEKAGGYRLDFADGFAPPEVSVDRMRRYGAWPLQIRFAEVDGGLVLAPGKRGAQALAAAAERVKAQAEAKDAGAPGLGGEAHRFPAGTLLGVLVRPAATYRALLALAAGPERYNLAALTYGLDGEKDPPIHVALGAGDGGASLRVTIPAASGTAIVTLIFNTMSQGISPRELLK
ncbi:MAG: hypothetical protein L6R28_08670 [Planctomycetes bacterium]|nr:hypothetical protein [Planctomycetota bacterium]